MDFSKFKPYDWIMVGGGVAMLILGFALDWTTIDAGAFGSASGDGPFDYFFPGGLAWLLTVAVGVLALLRAGGVLPTTQPWPLILLGLSGLAVLFMLIQLIMGARFDFADRGIGMYGAFVWAVIAGVGAFMCFKDSGGELSDLTDMDKIKGSFSGDDSAPPPPPPDA